MLKLTTDKQTDRQTNKQTGQKQYALSHSIRGHKKLTKLSRIIKINLIHLIAVPVTHMYDVNGLTVNVCSQCCRNTLEFCQTSV